MGYKTSFAASVVLLIALVATLRVGFKLPWLWAMTPFWIASLAILVGLILAVWVFLGGLDDPLDDGYE